MYVYVCVSVCLCALLDRSVGVLAYVMLTGISPFLGEDKQETFLNISQLNVSYAEEELLRRDASAQAFIQSLLCKQPQSVEMNTSHVPHALLLGYHCFQCMA